MSSDTDKKLWETCVGLGMAGGSLTGLFIHWHQAAMIGPGIFVGVVTGIVTFFLVRHRSNRPRA